MTPTTTARWPRSPRASSTLISRRRRGRPLAAGAAAGAEAGAEAGAGVGAGPRRSLRLSNLPRGLRGKMTPTTTARWPRSPRASSTAPRPRPRTRTSPRPSPRKSPAPSPSPSPTTPTHRSSKRRDTSQSQSPNNHSGRSRSHGPSRPRPTRTLSGCQSTSVRSPRKARQGWTSSTRCYTTRRLTSC